MAQVSISALLETIKRVRALKETLDNLVGVVGTLGDGVLELDQAGLDAGRRLNGWFSP